MTEEDQARVRDLSAIIYDVCETPDQGLRVSSALAEIIATVGKRPVTGETSDGYHTFNELYDHRISLFLALCTQVHRLNKEFGDYTGCTTVWRSKLHSDGTAIDGWFVMGIGTVPGEQITYHLPMARWSDTEWVGELERAPAFDGHTAADVLVRLRRNFTP